MTESTMTGDKPSDGLAAVAEALKKLTKAHSFQLVSLQNEIERLKSEREKSQEQITAMKDLMKKLYTEMANLKGLVAKLKIEGFVQGTPIKTESRQSPELNGVEDHKDAGLLDTVRSYGGSIEELADDILRKERGRLVNTLMDLQRIACDIDATASCLQHSNETLKKERLKEETLKDEPGVKVEDEE